VALGIARLSLFCRAGLCPATDSDRVSALFAACGLPTRLAEVGLENQGARLAGWMRRDKEQPGRDRAGLARGIGRAFLEPLVDAQRLAAFLDRAA
jgi:3-dehydroquinate synthase